MRPRWQAQQILLERSQAHIFSALRSQIASLRTISAVKAAFFCVVITAVAFAIPNIVWVFNKTIRIFCIEICTVAAIEVTFNGIVETTMAETISNVTGYLDGTIGVQCIEFKTVPAIEIALHHRNNRSLFHKYTQP